MNLLELQVPEWDSQDAKILRTFLETTVAKKAFAIVSELAPPLLDGADVNKTLLRSGEVKGWQSALVALVELVNHKPEPPAEPPSSYQDLDDESKWVGANPKA